MKTKHKKTPNSTRCCLSHINWSATNPAVVTRYGKLHQNKPGTNTVGEKKQKTKNREENRQKDAGVKVACKGHRLQEGIQEGKPRNRSEINIGQQHERSATFGSHSKPLLTYISLMVT